MKMLFFVLSLWSSLLANNIEDKMRAMVKEVKEAVQDENSPDLKAVERIIQQYCNMDAICTDVAKPYLLQETKSMDREAKKAYIASFLTTFKSVYSAYLARVWASKTNAQTFKNYDLDACKVDGDNVQLAFTNKSNQEKSYIMLILKGESIVSIKFGSKKDNMIDPISADRANCQEGVSKGKTPSEIFA